MFALRAGLHSRLITSYFPRFGAYAEDAGAKLAARAAERGALGEAPGKFALPLLSSVIVV